MHQNIKERNECPLIYKQNLDMARSSECFSKEQIVAAILEIDEGRTRPKDSGSFDYALVKDGFILLC